MPALFRRLIALAIATVISITAAVPGPAPVTAAVCTSAPDAVTLLEDTVAAIDVVANDIGCNYVVSYAQPAHGTATDDPFDDVNNWIYTPGGNYNGTDAVTYTAAYDDANVSALTTVSYTITPVNDAPSLFTAHPTLTVPEDAGVVTSGATGGYVRIGPLDEAAQTMTASVASNSNPALFASGPFPTLRKSTLQGGVYWEFKIGFTPAANAYGNATVQLALVDDGGTANGGTNSLLVPVPVVVTAVPDNPVAVDDAYGTGPGVQLQVGAVGGLLTNDTDADPGDMLVAAKLTDPAHGSAAVSLNGSFTYTPDPGFVGVDTFTYRVTDTFSKTDDATVTINVDGTAPTSTARTPAAGSTGRPRDTKPTITFNEAIDPATITASTFRIRDTTTGSALTATATYNPSTKKATLTPASLLPAGHTVKVYATTGIRDLAGNAFGGTSWSFKVSSDATRPKVVTKRPSPSATGVSRTANVYATFSESMRASTITTSTFRLKDTVTGSIVAATVTYDASLKRAKLNPSVTLAARRTYQVLVSSSIRDRAGNRLYSTSWSFKTGS